jgi:Ca2+:H+ antiporter
LKDNALGPNSAPLFAIAIAILTMVLPNYTTSVPGPVNSISQLTFVALQT